MKRTYLPVGILGCALATVLACEGTEPSESRFATNVSALIDSQGLDPQGLDPQGLDPQGLDPQGATLVATSGHDLQSLRLAGSGFDSVWVEKLGLVARNWRPPANITQSMTTACNAANHIGENRNCGWRRGYGGACTPGGVVEVGVGCGGLGGASGDPVLRVCQGDGTCEFGSMLHVKSVDDTTGCGDNVKTSFTCPASGRFTVMAGCKDAWETCDFEPRGRGPGVVFPLHSTLKGGLALTGATFSTTLPDAGVVQFRIQSITQDNSCEYVNPGDAYLYRVQVAVDGGWADACKPHGDGGIRAAFPVQAVWDETATRTTPWRRFTFACRSGVIAKCACWGYSGVGPSATASVDLGVLQQTCTRMATADYCGTGQGMTDAGTLINHWDELGIVEPAVDAGMFFEAAWNETGAVCLSKKRWENVPFTYCPNGKLYSQEYVDAHGGPTPNLFPDVCDTPQDAKGIATAHGVSVYMFNESYINAPDGGP